MKKLIGLLGLTLVLGFSTQESKAQDYNTAVGLRTGYGYGITLKQMLGGNAAVEGILNSVSNTLAATVLYEVHVRNLLDINRLSGYYGAGGTLALGGNNALGANGVLGLEYNFAEFPLNVTLDWIPTFYLLNSDGFKADHGGVGLRYYF